MDNQSSNGNKNRGAKAVPARAVPARGTLIIVESPAKARTIEKYLGPGYVVEASMGHLVDLPKSRLAIDVEHDFEPEYITIRGKAKILNGLQKAAGRSERVLLASDNDREGEAISHHLKNALQRKLPGLSVGRIVFNEITPEVIRDSVRQPREIDASKVDAQKARRILDRLVGYHLSPVLWSKVKNGLSAGRVQSVALRLICEREREVESFVPEEYWSLEAELQKGKATFRALLVEYRGSKPVLKQHAHCQRIMTEVDGQPCRVDSVKESEKALRPRGPLITSKLQQEAANRFGFTSRKTMQLAQQLYEGVDIGEGPVGLITYMRTDSTRIAESALQEVRSFLRQHYPQELPEKPQYYTPAEKAQDAHEAIRPTYVRNTPDGVREHLSADQFKLYSLIWERFVSSQMLPARTATVTVDIRAGEALFRASSTRVIEKGFQRVLKVLSPREALKPLPALAAGEQLALLRFHPEQHFTSGPPRYTDATIIKALEEKGIGRPSTYAPIISVLLDRYYVVRKSRQLVPTQLGRIINNLLTDYFPHLVNENFTADMEKQLDRIEEAGRPWVEVVRSFYSDFKPQVDHVMQTLESIKGILDEPTDYTCERCGRPMVKRLGRYGFFLACTGFPECRNTKSVPLADCPRPGCGGKIVARRRKGTGRGKEFYGCTNYPACDFVTYFKPTSQKCPRCGYFLVEKEDKQRGAYKACINPECNYLHTQEVEDQSA
jgi:DNA topoisomerase-1